MIRHKPGCSHCNLWMARNGEGEPGREDSFTRRKDAVGLERLEIIRMVARNGTHLLLRAHGDWRKTSLEEEKESVIRSAWVPSVVCYRQPEPAHRSCLVNLQEF